MTDTPMQGERGERGKQGDHGQRGEKGDRGEISTELKDEVHALIGSVTQLAAAMRKFPDREEVKREGRSRMWKALLFGVVLILIAQMLTLGTVSYCFLTPQPGNTDRPFCSVIPGYDRALEDGATRLARFELLLTEISQNQKANREQEIRIQILETRLAEARMQLREIRQRLTSTSP